MKDTNSINTIHPVMASVGLSANSHNTKIYVDINDIYSINDALEDRDKEIISLKKSIAELEETKATNKNRLAELQGQFGLDFETSRRLSAYNKTKFGSGVPKLGNQ